jgi:hypothetical protein
MPKKSEAKKSTKKKSHQKIIGKSMVSAHPSSFSKILARTMPIGSQQHQTPT